MTQGERITKIETQVDYIKCDVTEIKAMLQEHIKTENQFITMAESRKLYAPIWTEWGVKSLLAFTTASIIGFLINLMK
jgi:hypothetical protein